MDPTLRYHVAGLRSGSRRLAYVLFGVLAVMILVVGDLRHWTTWMSSVFGAESPGSVR